VPAARPPRAATRRAASTTETVGAVQSLDRGLRLIEQIARAGRNGVSLTDLALQVELAASTVHRLLGTLEAKGYVRRDPQLGRWYVGVQAFAVGNAFLVSRDLVAQARPHMQRLMETAGETVNLAVDDGEGAAVYIAQVESMQAMRMVVLLGSRPPIHSSAVGKAILSWKSDADIARSLAFDGLRRLTDHTLTTMTELSANLAEARRFGYACDIEEHTVGLHCVASAIFNESGIPIAALSLSGPKARMPNERLPEFGALVRDIAAAVTAELGGHAPAP
jgi:IclR family acetate operon transcriptional repressor